jgi:hypothetical protein
VTFKDIYVLYGSDPYKGFTCTVYRTSTALYTCSGWGGGRGEGESKNPFLEVTVNSKEENS